MNRAEWIQFKKQDPEWKERERRMEKRRAYMRGYNQRSEVKARGQAYRRRPEIRQRKHAYNHAYRLAQKAKIKAAAEKKVGA